MFRLLIIIEVMGFSSLVNMFDLNLFNWLDVFMNIELIVFICLCMVLGVLSCISDVWIIMLIMFDVFSSISVNIDIGS